METNRLVFRTGRRESVADKKLANLPAHHPAVVAELQKRTKADERRRVRAALEDDDSSPAIGLFKPDDDSPLNRTAFLNRREREQAERNRKVRQKPSDAEADSNDSVPIGEMSSFSDSPLETLPPPKQNRRGPQLDRLPPAPPPLVATANQKGKSVPAAAEIAGTSDVTAGSNARKHTDAEGFAVPAATRSRRSSQGRKESVEQNGSAHNQKSPPDADARLSPSTKVATATASASAAGTASVEVQAPIAPNTTSTRRSFANAAGGTDEVGPFAGKKIPAASDEQNALKNRRKSGLEIRVSQKSTILSIAVAAEDEGESSAVNNESRRASAAAVSPVTETTDVLSTSSANNTSSGHSANARSTGKTPTKTSSSSGSDSEARNIQARASSSEGSTQVSIPASLLRIGQISKPRVNYQGNADPHDGSILQTNAELLMIPAVNGGERRALRFSSTQSTGSASVSAALEAQASRRSSALRDPSGTEAAAGNGDSHNDSVVVVNSSPLVFGRKSSNGLEKKPQHEKVSIAASKPAVNGEPRDSATATASNTGQRSAKTIDRLPTTSTPSRETRVPTRKSLPDEKALRKSEVSRSVVAAQALANIDFSPIPHEKETRPKVAKRSALAAKPTEAAKVASPPEGSSGWATTSASHSAASHSGTPSILPSTSPQLGRRSSIAGSTAGSSGGAKSVAMPTEKSAKPREADERIASEVGTLNGEAALARKSLNLATRRSAALILPDNAAAKEVTRSEVNRHQPGFSVSSVATVERRSKSSVVTTSSSNASGSIPTPPLNQKRKRIITPPDDSSSAEESSCEIEPVQVANRSILRTNSTDSETASDEAGTKRRRKSVTFSHAAGAVASDESPLKHYDDVTGDASEVQSDSGCGTSFDADKSFLPPVRFIMPKENPTPNVRRSQRVRIPRLKHHFGEHVQYIYNEELKAFDAVAIEQGHVRDKLLKKYKTEVMPTKKQMAAFRRKHGMKRKRKMDELEDGAAERGLEDPIEVIEGSSGTTKPIKCFVKALSSDGALMLNDSGSPAAENDAFCFATAFDHPGFSTGQLRVRAFAEKPSAVDASKNTYFHLVNGKLEVCINGSTKIVRSDEWIFIPAGNSYTLKNCQAEEAVLTFSSVRSSSRRL